MFELQNQLRKLTSLPKNREAKHSETKHPMFDLLKNLCSKHQITVEQFFDFFNDPTHFTPAEWEQIQEHRAKVKDDIQRSLDNIANPVKTEQKYKELHEQRSWISMR